MRLATVCWLPAQVRLSYGCTNYYHHFKLSRLTRTRMLPCNIAVARPGPGVHPADIPASDGPPAAAAMAFVWWEAKIHAADARNGAVWSQYDPVFCTELEAAFQNRSGTNTVWWGNHHWIDVREMMQHSLWGQARPVRRVLVLHEGPQMVNEGPADGTQNMDDEDTNEDSGAGPESQKRPRMDLASDARGSQDM